MKNVLIIMLMAGLMMACANPAGEEENKNPFVGTWKDIISESNGVDRGLTFKDNGLQPVKTLTYRKAELLCNLAADERRATMYFDLERNELYAFFYEGNTTWINNWDK